MSAAEHATETPVHTLIERTRAATGLAVTRTDARVVLLGTAVAYLLAYLYALGHLAPGFGGVGVLVVEDPLARFFQPELGPLSFTPVGRVSLGPVTYLFSLNTFFGAGIAALVGLNLSLSYLAWRQPEACGIGRSSTGLFASIPALLSGTACCGPVVLIVLGIQASGLVVSAFQFLLPVAVVLLVASLLLVSRQVDPRAIERAG